MAVTYPDAEIAMLIAERKPLPTNWNTRFRLRSKRGHHEREMELIGDAGNEFHVILRKSWFNQLDFSVILAVRVPQSNRNFRLWRYNGKSHEHTNHIEGDSFYDFHIHAATERYQKLGTREDAYAEVTDRYGDMTEALSCLLTDAGFETSGAQGSMFLLTPEV